MSCRLHKLYIITPVENLKGLFACISIAWVQPVWPTLGVFKIIAIEVEPLFLTVTAQIAGNVLIVTVICGKDWAFTGDRTPSLCSCRENLKHRRQCLNFLLSWPKTAAYLKTDQTESDLWNNPGLSEGICACEALLTQCTARRYGRNRYCWIMRKEMFDLIRARPVYIQWKSSKS